MSSLPFVRVRFQKGIFKISLCFGKGVSGVFSNGIPNWTRSEQTLQVLNFGIYHQELNEMEEREEDCRGKWMKCIEVMLKLMVITMGLVQRVFGTFSAALGRYRHAQYVEQMPIAGIKCVVNTGPLPLIRIMHEKESLMIHGDTCGLLHVTRFSRLLERFMSKSESF